MDRPPVFGADPALPIAASPSCAGPVPVPRHPRHAMTGRSTGGRPAVGRRPRRADRCSSDGAGHSPTGRDPVKVEPADPRLRRRPGVRAMTGVAPGHADARPRQRPGAPPRIAPGRPSADGRRPARLRRLRQRRSDDPAPAFDADRPFATVEGPDPVPRPVATASSRSTAAAMAAPTARPTRPPTATTGSPGDIAAVMDATEHRAAVTGRPLRRRRLAGPPAGGPAARARRRDRRVRHRRARGSRRPTPGSLDGLRSTTLPSDEGWAKLNRHYWQRDYPSFAQFFFAAITSEPHSTKAIEDAAALGGRRVARRDAGRGRSRLPLRPRPEAIEAICRVGPLPDAPRPRHRRHCQPVARADRSSPS